MRAEDWPEWRGAGPVAIWKETGLLERFPEAGLKVTWRTPVHAGYSGPAVANGRVYVTDARPGTARRTIERVLALDVKDGRVIWQKDFVADFDATIPSWGATGAPLVDGARLITLVGGEPDAKVVAFNKHTGAELWPALSSDWEPASAR